MKEKSLATQLAGFIAKYTPAVGALARAALAKMRKRLPGAVQMMYDNYNALVVGLGPAARASDAVFSIVLYPRWVTLFFLNGATLPDCHKLLKGAGKQVRHIVLEDAATLDQPAVQALIALALERSVKPWDETKRGRMVIKSISAKQRPRRSANK
jgi:hypothetical protein